MLSDINGNYLVNCHNETNRTIKHKILKDDYHATKWRDDNVTQSPIVWRSVSHHYSPQKSIFSVVSSWDQRFTVYFWLLCPNVQLVQEIVDCLDVRVCKNYLKLTTNRCLLQRNLFIYLSCRIILCYYQCCHLADEIYWQEVQLRKMNRIELCNLMKNFLKHILWIMNLLFYL
jgi:hypothetical protein